MACEYWPATGRNTKNGTHNCECDVADTTWVRDTLREIEKRREDSLTDEDFDLAMHLGTHVEVHMYTDLIGPTGLASSSGLGKVRHIEVNQLWLQTTVNNGATKVNKIAGTSHQANVLANVSS